MSIRLLGKKIKGVDAQELIGESFLSPNAHLIGDPMKTAERSQDRRNGTFLAEVINPKRGTDRYVEFVNTQKGVLVGLLLSFPIWAVIIFLIIR